MGYDIEELNRSKWWERILLLFKPKHYCEDGSLMTLEYKMLFDRMFVYTVIHHPPCHPNCRCHLEI